MIDQICTYIELNQTWLPMFIIFALFVFSSFFLIRYLNLKELNDNDCSYNKNRRIAFKLINDYEKFKDKSLNIPALNNKYDKFIDHYLDDKGL